jgi:hypothetical protein
MSTWTAAEDAELAAALDLVWNRLGQRRVKGAYEAAGEMRSAAMPGNGFRTAHVPFSPRVRGPLVAVLREVAAEGHPLADRLNGIASGLEADAAVHHANGGR